MPCQSSSGEIARRVVLPVQQWLTGRLLPLSELFSTRECTQFATPQRDQNYKVVAHTVSFQPKAETLCFRSIFIGNHSLDFIAVSMLLWHIDWKLEECKLED